MTGNLSSFLPAVTMTQTCMTLNTWTTNTSTTTELPTVIIDVQTQTSGLQTNELQSPTYDWTTQPFGG